MIIVIVHHASNKPFYHDLRKSLKGVKYPVRVVENEVTKSRYTANPEGGYEVGALKTALRWKDDIFLLQDTCLIKNKRLFSIADQLPGGTALCHSFMSFLGKYRYDVLKEMEFPLPRDKRGQVEQENLFTQTYMKLDPDFRYFDQTLRDTEVFEERHGRTNMILENDYIIKYKATWKL